MALTCDTRPHTCFLLDFTQDVEEGWLHPVTVQSVFPETQRRLHEQAHKHEIIQNQQLHSLNLIEGKVHYYQLRVHALQTHLYVISHNYTENKMIAFHIIVLPPFKRRKDLNKFAEFQDG